MKNKLNPELEFFKETFKLISRDQRKFEYRLKTHPFGPQEKRILRGLYFLKKNKKSEAFDQIKCSPFADSFLEAIRRNVLGMLQLNFGTFRFAVEHFEDSIELFDKIQEQEFILYPILNLALAYGNQRRTNEMAKYLDLAAEYKTQDEYLHILQMNVEALYFVMTGNLARAKKVIKSKALLTNQFYEWFKPSFQLMEFELYLKEGSYNTCYEILSLYKMSKGYTVKTNYQYMKTLLDHLVSRSPLYIYPQDFQEFPELFQQLEVIKSLSRGDLEQAQKYWKLLETNNPKLYASNFSYRGGLCLFSETLKIYSDVKAPDLNLESVKDISDLYERLHKTFEKIDGPVQKDKLIEILWGEEITESTRSRLRKLVSRFNKKYSEQILSRQDSYYLQKKAA